MNRPLHAASLWLPVVIYGGLVYYLSSLSHIKVSTLSPDYVSHTAEYIGLTVLVIRALNDGLLRPIPGTLHFSAVGLAVLYAVSDEIHQMYVPNRTASVKDIFSDTLGAVLAVGLSEVIQRYRSPAGRGRLGVILYTRKDCHLCHEARDLLRSLAQRLPVDLSEVDVDTDPDLSERYGAEVPVIVAAGRTISKLTPRPRNLSRRLSRLASRLA